ncbi:SpoIIE family protein phosphatase [uncultured Paludibaculum sp.]|uniref:PP2C family protein-serine/threonine phosphatase n=1 Tax=uncultured Paludibaculum sp. TaxID=1765020 RepID=UPI002AAA7036|nr:SpoIIE family protein phosphatase [uncultured Paludibaculum sp.]
MRILVADDQPDVLLALRFLLKAEGFTIQTADHPAAILQAVRQTPPDLVLMDLNYTRDTTSGEEGLDALAQLQQLGLRAPIIVMTAWGSVELAVEAMRRGAADFVMKPWDNERLLNTLRKHMGQAPASRVTQDLDLARQVQAQLLPQRRPSLKTLEYDGHCRQAGAVGGDYFDFLELAPGRVGLLLADISGKGIAAALLMSNLQAALRSLAWQATRNLPLLLRTLNLQFLESTPPERFATLFFSDYDDNTRTLRYANCGHNPPLLLRANGDVEWLKATGPVIGLLDVFQPEVGETRLAPGDRLIIYSDGVTDARGPGGDDLGDLEFAQIVRQNPAYSPEQLTAHIAALSPGEQFDDMTMVLARAV